MGRYIAGYVGVGNFSAERTPGTADEARTMLRSTYLVQEFIHGGPLKDIVIDQVHRYWVGPHTCIWKDISNGPTMVCPCPETSSVACRSLQAPK